jgi:HEPN domain-containing protein
MSDASIWIAKARSDLDMVDRAMTPATNQNLEQAAYHLQQAAEKTIKALLDHLGIAYPRSGGRGHDIGLAANMIPADHRLRVAARALAFLTPWATVYRYPHEDPATAPAIPTPTEIDTWRARVDAFIKEVAADILSPHQSTENITVDSDDANDTPSSRCH